MTQKDQPKGSYFAQGTILFSMGLLLYLALFSYNPFDSSDYAVSLPKMPITNLCGILGAKIAAILFYQFGLVSFLFVLPFVFHGLFFLCGRKHVTLLTLLKWSGIIFSALVTLPLFKTHLTWDSVDLAPAGQSGYLLSKFLKEHLGLWGLYITTISVVLISLPSQWFYRFKLFGLLSILDKTKKIRSPFQKTLKKKDSTSTENSSGNVRVPLKNQGKKYTVPGTEVFQGSIKRPLNNEILESCSETAKKLENSLKTFGVIAQVVGFKPGPVVTVFEIKPAPGTKMTKLTSLADDIALTLKVDSIFIYPVSGKDLLGFQVPNEVGETVYFGEVIRSDCFIEKKSPLSFALGKNINGEPVCEALDDMPHLLMAGQTGSGKSVAINSLICSILLKANPDEVRFILVDPKVLELKIYEGIPHLLMPVITDPKRASAALKWATSEMERRYQLMEKAQVRHISGFNSFWSQKTLQEKLAFSKNVDMPQDMKKIPYLVVIIDELADLMLNAPKDVESSIQRLAQKARACGIHLVLATQRPSVDVITGVIKANLPSRIAFKVFSRGDSRTILDSMGAEKLLGRGDLLYLKPGRPKLERIQGAFLSDDEVVTFAEKIKGETKPCYEEQAIKWIEESLESGETPNEIPDSDSLDMKWDEALEIASTKGFISASYLQRQLKIGYNRAARVVEAMERQGLIGKADGAKPRQWLGDQR